MQDKHICGLHAVLAALKKNPRSLEEIWISQVRNDKRIAAIIATARQARVKIHELPRVALDRMTEGVRHQGVVARRRESATPSTTDLTSFLANLPVMPLMLVLDGVQDPHNFGACLRSADAAGAHAVIVPRERSAPLSAVARRAASGAAESVPVFAVTNLARALSQLKESGIWLVGADQNTERAIFSTDLRQPLALVLGGEGRGLRRLTREACDMLVRIPMMGSVESLNVSVTAGICLFETLRQRQ